MKIGIIRAVFNSNIYFFFKRKQSTYYKLYEIC